MKGYGRDEESWGIQYGVIPGRPDEDSTWEMLDEIINREWRMENGKKLRATATFIDAGGHHWDDVTKRCHARRARRVYAVRGDNKDTGPLMSRIRQTKNGFGAYKLNVYVGKRAVLYNAALGYRWLSKISGTPLLNLQKQITVCALKGMNWEMW